MRSIVLAALVSCIAFGTAAAENVDPGDDGSQYAWSENAGWLNAEPAGPGGPGVEVSDFGVAGFMWSENAGWISLNGIQNDGHGNLSGLAWAENAGWVRFANPQGGVRIDPSTGKWSGQAWSENLGWISFPSDNGIKTGWCQATAAVPTGSPSLRAARSGNDVELSQLTLAGGASWHEVVRGSLSSLRASGGNFAAASLDCAAENVTQPKVVVAGTPSPTAGDGYWYLARRVNCKGKGTFDSGVASQVGARDAEIAAAGIDCP